MADRIVSSSFNRDVSWRRINNRLAVFLDTNCWINMADEKSSLATQVKRTLLDRVSKNLLFCPVSFGLICELYKQSEDSRLRTGTLMEALSLNVSYASHKEIFAWEVERAVRRLADAGPIDLSLDGIYVPLLGFLTSRFRLKYPEGFPSKDVDDCTGKIKARLESLTLTQWLRMSAGSLADGISDFVRHLPAPKYSEESKRIWNMVKGSRHKIQRIEDQAVFHQYIKPAIRKLPPPVLVKFREYAQTVPKDNSGGFLGEFLKSLPALNNYSELMATIAQNPTRTDKINDFFDLEIMAAPLAYATVFVSEDKGIRNVLHQRTRILKRNNCQYCSDLMELAHWLDVHG
jgi:hypothetical protein